MAINVGTIDRVLRALIGAALLYVAFMSGLAFVAEPVAQYAVAAIGAVLLATAAFRFCPLYRVLGLSSCSKA